ncbi:MAG: PQQ-binding-like beta-propeller repeat protein [Promethearchaeota archaeon]
MELKSKLKSIYSQHKKSISIGLIVVLITVPVLAILLPALIDYYYEEPLKEGDKDIDSLLWRFGRGMPGTGATMEPQKVTFTPGGEEYIVVGTDGGIATLTLDGVISMSYMTFGEVITFDLIQDISGDNQKDIVLVVYDRDHANVIAIASNNGYELWKYDPRVLGYDSETFAPREFITYTWDIEVVEDINDDDVDDVIISSWNKIIALEGDDGDEIWENDDACTNDIWNIEYLDDKIIAGSEAGELVALNLEDGKLEWTSEIKPTTIIPLRSMAVVVEREIPSSINDIIIDGDNIIVSADNGYLYLVDGDDGEELDDYEFYEIDEYDEEVGDTTDVLSSPYSCERRVFQRAGFKLFETIDTNNDGINDYAGISFHLEYSDEDFHELEDVEFNGFSFNCKDDKIDDFGEFEYDETLYTASYPVFIRVNSEIRAYLYRNNFETGASGSTNPQGIYYSNYIIDNFNPARLTRVVRTGDDWDDEMDDDETISKYLLNVGDVNNDNVDDLFAISDDGKYLLIDTKNNQIIWSRTKGTGATELTLTQDIDKDGVRDYLFKRFGDFDPTWRDYSGDRISIPSWRDYNLNEGDLAEDQGIIFEFLTISAKTGRVIWEFSVPNPDYYEGLRDVVNIGDITGDNIDDYAGWIIPTDYPPELVKYIRDISGSTTISLSSGDANNDNYREEAINRALLVGYTRFLAISGNNGSIFWNTPLNDMPYKYYREFGYSGNDFEKPINPYSTKGNITHRTYNEIPLNWTNGDRDYIQWEDPWDCSTLIHPSKAEVESGITYDQLFNLFGEAGTNYTITSHDSSGEVLIGNPQTISSEETKAKDNYYWIINSESSGGSHKVSIEMTFNQSLEIQGDSEYLIVDYAGNLTTQISEISISIYNFSAAKWVKISPNSINSTSLISMRRNYEDISDIVESTNDNLVRIKVEAIDDSSFSLSIDELVVKYLYELGSYEVEAIDKGSRWEASINFTIPLEFGFDWHELTQIERISAMVWQSLVKVNIPGVYKSFNFTYSVYNTVESNWSLLDTIDPNNRVVATGSSMNSWHAGFRNTSIGGHRYDNTSFELTDNFRYDKWYMIKRGTYNPVGLWGIDNGVEFDYENETQISQAIDSNNNILFRINITNGYKPFNLTLDSFGIAAFYWGLYGNDWDQYYVYDINSDEWDDDLENILNLRIQDFEVINGTGDNYFDVIVVCGMESEEQGWGGDPEWGSRLILFDVKNREISAKWGYDSRDKIPYQIVRVTYLNSSQNGWLLSGTFDTVSGTIFSHAYIKDADWDNTITNYDSYSAPTILYQSYSINITKGENFYEIPGTTEYRSGRLGLILGHYSDDESWHTYLKIIDAKTQLSVCYINPINLEYLGRGYWWDSGNDFSRSGAGYKLKFSYADFNGDGYLDHVGLASGGQSVKIFSGSAPYPGDPIVEINLEELIEEGEVSEDYDEWQGDEIDTSFKLSFASAGDLNDDGIEDGIVGFQVGKDRWEENLYSKGAAVLCIDIKSSSGTDLEKIEPDEWNINNDDGDDDDDDNDDDGRGFDKHAWELEAYDYEYEWGDDRFEYFDYVENIGDFNGDGHDDILCGHYSYELAEGAYITGHISDLLDVFNQKLLYRFNLATIDAIYTIGDISGDGKNEFIIQSGEMFFCVNSEFQVEFKDLEDDDKMSSNRFTIEWETEGDYEYFELVIDGNVYTITEYCECEVFLGPGEKKVQVFMYDQTGVVIAVAEVIIEVPGDYTMWILTAIMASIVAIFLFIYRKAKNKKRDIVLIDREKKMEEFKA